MSDRDKIRRLEEELADLRRRMNRLDDRPSLVQPSRYTRLAKTVKDPVYDDYPDAGSSDTFWVVFLDGTYTADSDTEQTPVYTDRQPVDDAQVTAHNLLGGWVREGTVVHIVFHPGVGQPGQWWFFSRVMIPIELKDDLALFGSATVYHLDDAGLRTTTEEEATDILGFYEGVGADDSGSGDDAGDKGWCERLTDGKLKFVALSCEPPGPNTAAEADPPEPPSVPDPEPEPEPDPELEFEPFGGPQLL